MLIEGIDGNLLLAALIAVAVLLVAAVLILRLRMAGGGSQGSGLLSFLSRGNRGEDAEDGEAATADSLEGLVLDGSPGSADDFRLPDLDGLDDLGGLGGNGADTAPSGKKGGKKKVKKEPSPGIGAQLKSLLGALTRKRKSKDELKHDVKEIDDQLNQVLAESQGISMDMGAGGKMPDISNMGLNRSDAGSAKPAERDLRTGGESRRPEMKPPEQPGMMDSMGLAPPDSMGTAPPGSGGGPAASKASAPGKAPEPAASAPAPKAGANMFDGKGGDFMSQLMTETAKEEKVDLSIMKDMKDVPVSVEELEVDLQGILDQVSYNAKMHKKKPK